MALWKDGWMALWKDRRNFPLAAFGGWRLYNQGRIWQILFEPTDMITLIIIITNVIINRSQVKLWTTSQKWYQSKLGHFFVSQLFRRSFTNICVEPISGRQRGKGNFQLNDFGNCSAAECRRRRKMVATYRNIIKSWLDLPSIMMMIMMMMKGIVDIGVFL